MSLRLGPFLADAQWNTNKTTKHITNQTQRHTNTKIITTVIIALVKHFLSMFKKHKERKWPIPRSRGISFWGTGGRLQWRLSQGKLGQAPFHYGGAGWMLTSSSWNTQLLLLLTKANGINQAHLLYVIGTTFSPSTNSLWRACIQRARELLTPAILKSDTFFCGDKQPQGFHHR